MCPDPQTRQAPAAWRQTYCWFPQQHLCRKKRNKSSCDQISSVLSFFRLNDVHSLLGNLTKHLHCDWSGYMQSIWDHTLIQLNICFIVMRCEFWDSDWTHCVYLYKTGGCNASWLEASLNHPLYKSVTSWSVALHALYEASVIQRPNDGYDNGQSCLCLCVFL